MIKVHENTKQTPDSNIESPSFQFLQRVHKTDPVKLKLPTEDKKTNKQKKHTQRGVSTFHRIPMHRGVGCPVLNRYRE